VFGSVQGGIYPPFLFLNEEELRPTNFVWKKTFTFLKKKLSNSLDIQIKPIIFVYHLT
jgi:hypothetical protein